ncbi:hypothetical protein FRACYDRAFT_261552 [Fragilariopsis cylindrus CCMP1102]|uniref:Uncharacterized protein n=1 Tax=Fragilariopsis cylindrus CCMP1102 TaxID=635003 RepID=A0A1E7FBI5_9STRA|nr:hypothetical protein FRACYDRAFT_261552 [Fragilariopsis cylindrus CCMP1102]|eukprot:OEU15173.1 hypothetical protein FRACYDRAFT_261552 [Fragilariopsis cylindrus CCMP1102]
MVTPSDSPSSYRNRDSGDFFSSFEKSSVKSEMKSSGNNDRSAGTYDGVQRSSWNGASSTNEHIGSEGHRRGPSLQSGSISMSPGRNKRGTKIVTNVNTTNKMESASFASRKNDQWNVKRDIPTGTVRNNPFLPQPKTHSPQLKHQKRQCDTSNITRGSVAARILESDSPRSKSGGNTPISPSKTTRGSNGRPSPSSTSFPGFSHDGNDGPASLTSDSSRSNERGKCVTNNSRVFSPMGGSSSWQTKSFSVSPEKKILQQQSSQRSNSNNEKREKAIMNRSEPSREVPNGTVKARVSTMYKETKPTETASKLEYTKTKTVAYHQSVRGTAVKKTMSVEDVKIENGTDNDNDEDPWIIPERNTATAQVFAGDWGEAVVPAKSTGSDDWETPAKDWIRSGESQTASFLNEAEQKSSKSQKTNFHNASFHNQQQHNTSGIRDGDEIIPQSAKGIVPVSDEMIGARVQPLQAHHVMDGFQDGNSRKALDRTRNRYVAPVLAPPPKDANTYHRAQGRVSKNRMKEGVEAISTKSNPSSSQAFDNSFEHFSTKTGMISSISTDNAQLGSIFGKSRDQHVHSRPVSYTTTTSTIRAKQTDLDTKVQESKKHLRSSDAFGFPRSSHEMNGNEKVKKDICEDEFFGKASSDKTCDHSRINERNSLSRRPSSTMSYNSSKNDEDEDEDEEGCDSNDESNTPTGDSKKKKKGFFKGLFGRKNKEKDNSKNKETTKDKNYSQNRTGRSNSKSSFTDSMTMDDPHFVGNSRSFSNSQAQTSKLSSQTGLQSGNMTFDTIVDHSTQEESHSEDLKGRENHVLKGDTTVSDMANSIVFKDVFCPPSMALKEHIVPALSTIGDIPDESFTPTASPVKSIVARDSNFNDIEPENPSGVSLSETTEVDACVDPELDHLDIDMEIDSEEDEKMIAPLSKSMPMTPPPPPPPPQRKQRKSATSNVQQSSNEEKNSSQKDLNETLQNTEERGEEIAVESKKSTFDSETMAGTKEDSSSPNGMNKSDPLLQEMAEGGYSPTVIAQTQEDSDKMNPVLLPDYSGGKVPSQTGTKEDNNQDRTTLIGRTPSRNILQRDSGRQSSIMDTSPVQTVLRGVSPSRNAVKLAGQARISNVSPENKNSEMISRGVSPARNVVKFTGRMRIRDTTSPGSVDTQKTTTSRGTSPARNALKSAGRVKLGDASPARKEKTQESTVKGARKKFSSPASRNLRVSSPVRKNVEPTKNKFSKSSIVPQKTQLDRSSLQTRQSAQVHLQQSLIIPKGHPVEETNILSRYRKKTVFNNVQSVPIATHSSGHVRQLVSRKAHNIVTRSPRSSFSSQTSQDTTDEIGRQSTKFSKANHAYRSIVVKKNRSEDIEENRRYLSIPESSTSASDLSCSSSKYDTYQKKLADSLRKANIGTQSSAEYSVHSHRSLDDSSIESDIRILRSILRRPRLDQNNENVITASRKIEGFPTYDEESSTDPMQRVGLRLLSTAIIPIQTEVRRFLAMRQALTRMWALIVVQTYTRNVLAKKHYHKALNSITVIQATFRGHRARNYIIDKHICAIEIQRFVRGYLATMKVYEEIYKVTLVQSLVRKRIAMDYAAYRMALIIQLQAAARRFLVRRRRSRLDTSATLIQSCWRCFYNRLTYQFDLLDIIIVQSLWRKKLGIRAAARKVLEKQNAAATAIAAEWRKYDARMDLVCYLATRQIQTTWRCYITRNRYTIYKASTKIASVARMFLSRCHYVDYQAATVITSVARRFLCRIDFVEHQSCTKIASVARMYICRNEYVNYQAAVIIQSVARRFLVYSDYKEYKSATKIASIARMYFSKVAYVDYKASTKIASVARMFLSRCHYVDYQAATIITSVARRFLCRIDFVEYQSCTKIASVARMYICRNEYVNYQAAVIIQSVARKFLVYSDYKEYKSATKIASIARMYLSKAVYIDYKASTKIASVARMYMMRSDYICYIAARRIQTQFRASTCRKDYIFYIAARRIQTKYRSSTCRKDYVTFIADLKEYKSASKIASIARMYLSKAAYIDYKASTKIASVARMYISRSNYMFYIAARRIQNKYRASTCRKDYVTFIAARKIQTIVRSYVCRKEYIENFAATMIQTKWRSYDCSSMYHRYCAARVISKTWRSYDCKMNYLHFLADILIVQSTIRRFLVQKQVKAMKNRAATKIQRIYRGYACLVFYTETVAATAIARTWRGYVCYADYEEFKASRKVQSIWRRYTCFAFYKEYKASRKIQSAWRREYKREKSAILIQSAWRGFLIYADYMFEVADIVVVQKQVRGWLARREANRRRHSERNNAAITMQKNWRRFVNETEFVLIKYENRAATTIQKCWRRFWCFSNFIIALDCSIQIQAQMRCYLQKKEFASQKTATIAIQSAWRKAHAKQLTSRLSIIHEITKTSFEKGKIQSEAAVRIQRVFRGSLSRSALKVYLSAVKIQSRVRGAQARVAIKLYLMVRKIQTIFRGHTKRQKYVSYISARKVQATWRGCHLRQKYVIYIAARKIQKIWRGYSPHRSYVAFIAARCIQNKWRYVKANQEVLIMRGEFIAASLIQNSWRGFVAYTDFVFTLSDIVAAQRIARGYLTRKKYSTIIRSNIVRKKNELNGSILIQKICRGFQARQNYWYTLGCTMQIQSWWRGQLVSRIIKKNDKAILMLQCFARRCLARQEYMQRRFVFLLIQTAEAERSKKIKALRLQEEVREDMEEIQQDAAARIIQRFFLFVKHEVDQLLLVTKRRKKWRKQMKVEKRTDDVEEALLEDVWLGLVARGNMEEEPFTRHYTNFGAGSVGEDSIAGSRVRKQQLRHPTSSAVVGLHQYDDDDDTSEFSQLTGSTMAYAPHPTTSIRMIRKVDAIDMDDDFQLEEAFIDAEIHHAKERRHLAGNKSKKKDRPSSRKSVDYSQLDWKQGQRNINSHKANNNVSTMSRILTMSNH